MRNRFKIYGMALLACANVYAAASSSDDERSRLSSRSVPHLAPYTLSADPSGISIRDLSLMNSILGKYGRQFQISSTSSPSRLDQHATDSMDAINMAMKSEKKRVLSLDGGGTRGVICLIWLCEIERLTGRKIHEIFDHIVGTSTGGLIATLLTLRGIYYEDSKLGINIKTPDAPMSAQEALDLFMVLAEQIFSKTTSKLGRMNPYTVFREKPLETLLELLAKGRTISECKPPITLTSYDIKENKRVLFSSFESSDLLTDSLRATTAAPGYFAPTPDHRVDGGISHNNPSLIAVTQTTKHLDTHPLDQILVSINNGSYLPSMSAKEMVDLTRPSIGLKVLDVVFSGKATDSDCVDVFNSWGAPDNYYRFETNLPDSKYNEVSLTDLKSLKELIGIAQKAIGENQEKLQKMIKALDLPPLPSVASSSGSSESTSEIIPIPLSEAS